jgi:hypothetical protein
MGRRTTKCDLRTGDVVGGTGHIKKNVEVRVEADLEIGAATSDTRIIVSKDCPLL